jgi:small subunit ribosomal protein S16
MLKIRLARAGTTNRPFYHIVVANSTSPRDGKFIEKLGFYNPLAVTDKVKIDGEQVDAWLKKGATPTERVAVFLKQAGIGQNYTTVKSLNAKKDARITLVKARVEAKAKAEAEAAALAAKAEAEAAAKAAKEAAEAAKAEAAAAAEAAKAAAAETPAAE